MYRRRTPINDEDRLLTQSFDAPAPNASGSIITSVTESSPPGLTALHNARAWAGIFEHADQEDLVTALAAATSCTSPISARSCVRMLRRPVEAREPHRISV